jgi:hypothetical protein
MHMVIASPFRTPCARQLDMPNSTPGSGRTTAPARPDCLPGTAPLAIAADPPMGRAATACFTRNAALRHA